MGVQTGSLDLRSSNGKNKLYYQGTEPAGGVAGDTWFDTSNGYEIYRYTGSAWEKAGLTSAAFSTVEVGGASIGLLNSLLIHNADDYWNLSNKNITIDQDTYAANTLKTSHLIAREDIDVQGGDGSIVKIPTESSGDSYVALQSGGLETVLDFTTGIGAKITTQWKSSLMPGAATIPMMYARVDITDYAMYAQSNLDLCTSLSLETNGLVMFKQGIEADYLHEGITYHGYDQASLSNQNAHNFKLDPVNKSIKIGGNSTTDWSFEYNASNLTNLGKGSYPTQAYHNGACAVYTYDNTMCKYMSFAVDANSKTLYVYGSNNGAAVSYIGRVQLT